MFGFRRRLVTAAVASLVIPASVMAQGVCSALWAQRVAYPAPAGNPSARGYPGIAYDPTAQRVLMYGGGTNSAGFRDLWQWNGTSWSLLGLSTTVGIRKAPFFCYDTARQKAVLFGGAFTLVNDTWEWDGGTSVWTQVATTGPSLRGFGAMVYDPAGSRSVLFGGWSNSFNYFNDTWSWNGTAWTQIALTGDTPHTRGFHAMAYDASRGKIVMFGGLWNDISSSNYLGDTWEFDGTSWTQVFPLASPPPRAYHSMAYDPIAHVVVLHAGFEITAGQFSDTWTWDGTSWTQMSDVNTPSGTRQALGMAYDAARANVVVFGGARGSTFRNDTWTFTLGSGAAPEITTQPSDVVGCVGGSAMFEVVASGSGLTYQWRHNSQPILGENSSVLLINSTFGPETGPYDCVVQSSCGSITSTAATLSMCFADLDDGTGTNSCDGGVDINDLLFFLGAFEAGDAAADLDNGSGTGTPDAGVDINDLLFFLLHFEAGC